MAVRIKGREQTVAAEPLEKSGKADELRMNTRLRTTGYKPIRTALCRRCKGKRAYRAGYLDGETKAFISGSKTAYKMKPKRYELEFDIPHALAVFVRSELKFRPPGICEKRMRAW